MYSTQENAFRLRRKEKKYDCSHPLGRLLWWAYLLHSYWANKAEPTTHPAPFHAYASADNSFGPFFCGKGLGGLRGLALARKAPGLRQAQEGGRHHRRAQAPALRLRRLLVSSRCLRRSTVRSTLTKRAIWPGPRQRRRSGVMCQSRASD